MARTLWYFVVFSFLVSNLASQGNSSDRVPRQSAPKGRQDIISATLDRFQGVQAGDFRGYFKSIRPPRLTEEMKTRVFASLPPEGEANPAAGAAPKLGKLAPIFAYHDRESVIEVKVIRVLQAAVAMHARCVLLVSEQALRLLTAAEIQALVAHELGHEYVWDEYESAKGRGEQQRIQILELWCDGVAILTLLDLGLDPWALASGISKINRFNSRFGTPDNADDYPSDRMRADFQKSLSVISNMPAKRPAAGPTENWRRSQPP